MSSNREVQSTFVIYRGVDSPVLLVGDESSTVAGQAYADMHVGFVDGDEMFLLIPIEKVNSLINDLLECIARHR